MKTLGYIALDWISEHLPSPGDPTSPFVATDDQARFVLRRYAIEGGFVYRRALLQQSKGWGKSPLGAALALFEFAGPALPDGTDARGEPVGRPWGTGGAPPPWVQIAASSEDQAASNVYALVFEVLMVNHGKAASKLGIDEGRTRLYLKSQPGSKLETVTASAGAREGQRVTFGLMDETHLMTQPSGGQRLARTIRRNVAKMNGRSLECANAPELGATSVAEQTAAEAAAGEPGLLFVARRPRVEPSPSSTRPGGRSFASTGRTTRDRSPSDSSAPTARPRPRSWRAPATAVCSRSGSGSALQVPPMTGASRARRCTA